MAHAAAAARSYLLPFLAAVLAAYTIGRPPVARRAAAVSGIIAAGLTLLALALRAALAMHGGLWRDEGLFLFILRMPSFGDILVFLREHESHPPLFYLLMRGWQAIAGESYSAALVPCVLFGAAVAPATYLAGLRAFSRRAAVLAAALVALSPPLAEYAASVRPYTLLALLSVAACYNLWRGLTRGGLRAWLAYTVAMTAMLYTHNWAWLVLAAQWLPAITAPILSRARPAVSVWREWLAAQAAILAAYAPWLPVLMRQAAHAGEGGPFTGSAAQALWIVQQAVTALSVPFTLLLLSGILAGGAWRAVARRRGGHSVQARDAGAPADADARLGATVTDAERGAALAVFAGVPLLALLLASLLSRHSDLLIPWCITIITPCALLALAHGISALTPPQRPLVPLLIAAALLRIYAFDDGLALRQTRSNARELAGMVAARALPSDLIVIVPDWYASSFNYYFEPANLQIDFPEPGRTGATAFNDIQSRYADPLAWQKTQRDIRRAHAAGRRIWLITGNGDLANAAAGGRLRGRSPVNLSTTKMYLLLQSLYGDSRLTLCEDAARQRNETLCALMFAPPG